MYQHLMRSDEKVFEAIAKRHPGRRNGLKVVTLSVETQLSRRTVIYAIKRLTILGLISTARSRPGIPYNYEVYLGVYPDNKGA